MPAIDIQIHPAAQVLSVELRPFGRAGVPFLDWRVTARPVAARTQPPSSFAGAGLYGVCFDGSLIYVGSYLGKSGRRGGAKAAHFEGDIVSARWWQHFGSITGRAHCLSVGARTLVELQQEFGAEHPMIAALTGAEGSLGRDAGCLGALNRLRLAASHFAEFNAATPESTLLRFEYVYARVVSTPQTDATQLAGHIASAERSLVARLNPLANGTGRQTGKPHVNVSCAAAGTQLADALREQIAK
jgi:hypothetical protein